MAQKTTIGWTATYHEDGSVTPGSTWNPVSGCSRVSDGCRNCYAEALSLRFGWSKKPWTHANAAENVMLHPERLNAPRVWKTPQRVFVNSMADLFHELVPDEFIAQVFAVMADLPQHAFQILTKRPERAAQWKGPWPAHIWMGTSVEDRRARSRIDALRSCPAQILFLSCEPLLQDLGQIDLSGYQWVIAGAESGRYARPMDDDWVRSLRDQCFATGVSFFFKQRVINGRKDEAPILDGERWAQFPEPRKQEDTQRVEQPLLFG